MELKCRSSLANSREVLWEAAAKSAESLRGKTMTRKADLIDRAALLADINTSVVFSGRQSRNAEICGANKIINRIKAAPTVDAVELVRCKDCKWLYDEMDDYCCRSHRGLVRICKNSFCSYGERKTDGKTD